MTQSPLTRRAFLKTSAAAAAAITVPAVWPSRLLGANERLDVAGIGVGGKGESDIGACEGENVVALCDVDAENAAATFKKFPAAKRYQDFRRLLEAEKGLDAVTVSTPDHVHAPASVMAMKLGKHVYCQKPLTHSVHEARVMTDLAREKKLVTQMGNQGYSHPRTRRLVELIRAGVLGGVRAIHVWTDRPIWPQGIDRPQDRPAVPSTLDWDLWLGPAPERPYHPAYVPFKWRGWWDFGTGALGDMACHNMGLAFFALDLGPPLTIEAESSGLKPETCPSWSVIRYTFPAKSGPGKEGAAPIQMTWYDGGKKPSPDLVKAKDLPANGIIIAGEKDTLFVPSYWGSGGFVSGTQMDDFKDVPESLPRHPGAKEDNDFAHHAEWLEAIKGKGPKPSSSFDHSGPMTEAVLLGNVALRAGKKLDWDAKAMKVTNAPEANQHLRREYRRGWTL